MNYRFYYCFLFIFKKSCAILYLFIETLIMNIKNTLKITNCNYSCYFVIIYDFRIYFCLKYLYDLIENKYFNINL